MLGLCYCTGFSLLVVGGGYSLAAVRERLILVISLSLRGKGSRAYGLQPSPCPQVGAEAAASGLGLWEEGAVSQPQPLVWARK